MKKKWKLLKHINSKTDINDKTKVVMFWLLDRENNQTGKLFPSQERLSLDTGYSKRTIQRSIKELIDGKYIAQIRRGRPGRANEYVILYHSHAICDVDRRQLCREYTTALSTQLTNELTNKLTVEQIKNKLDDISYPMDKTVSKVLSSYTKMLNPNYRAVVEGEKKAFNHPDSIEARMMKKTDDYHRTKAWRRMYDDPDTRLKAIEIAKDLGIIKDYKKYGR